MRSDARTHVPAHTCAHAHTAHVCSATTHISNIRDALTCTLRRYHFDDNPAAPSVELCLDEVKSAMKSIGFVMVEERDGIDADYIADDNSMMRTA